MVANYDNNEGKESKNVLLLAFFSGQWCSMLSENYCSAQCCKVLAYSQLERNNPGDALRMHQSQQLLRQQIGSSGAEAGVAG